MTEQQQSAIVDFTLERMRKQELTAALALVEHAYLEYDNSYALARKCTWALADTGTAEAQEKLRLLAGNQDPVSRKRRG